MTILFYDVGCPIPYTNRTLEERALGGTEASVVRVAHGLKNFHSVYVAQHNRKDHEDLTSEGVHYISLEQAKQLSPDTVILLNYFQKAEEIAALYPHAKRFLWMHNMPSRKLFHACQTISKHDYAIIAVSYFHKLAIQKRLHGKWYKRIFRNSYASSVPIHVMYNPLADYLKNEKSSYNPNQLVFVSSQHKGLAETLKMFSKVLKHFPDYELFVTNPGYKDVTLAMPKQCYFIGALPHKEVIQKVKESFCVFYPQTVRLETFGLVYAEANAVGTPVLAHDFGPANEILSDSTQLVDGNNLQAILSKMNEWKLKRPHLHAKPAFKIDQVINNWLNLLNK